MSGAIGKLRAKSSAKAALPPKSQPLNRRCGSLENIAVTKHSGANVPKPSVSGHVEIHSEGQTIESQYIRNLQQQIYYLELENSHLKQQLKRGKDLPVKIVDQADVLLEKLRKVHIEKEYVITQLRQKDEQVEATEKEKAQMLQRLRVSEEMHNRDRITLSEELVEFRKKLDDVMPDIAKREAEITKLRTELHSFQNKARTAQLTIDTLQSQLAQKGKEESVMRTIDAERRNEIQQVIQQVRELEVKISEYRAKERILQEEIASVKRQIREKELESKRERALSEKISEENQALIRENSELAAKASRLQTKIDQDGLQEYQSDLISRTALLSEQERQLRQDLLKTQDQLKIEQFRSQQFTLRINEIEMEQVHLTEGQSKLLAQNDALDAFSRELSADNKQLRIEKNRWAENMLELQKTLTNKDTEIERLRDTLESKEEQLREFAAQYENEFMMQEEKARKFETLARQVRELARSSTKHVQHTHVSSSYVHQVREITQPETPISEM